jgi:hypothetical protein
LTVSRRIFRRQNITMELWQRLPKIAFGVMGMVKGCIPKVQFRMAKGNGA